jgi:hypothetical protein
MEQLMTKFGTLGAAAVVACMLAGPAMAQQVIPNASRCAQLDETGNCQNLTDRPSTRGYHRAAYRHEQRDWNARNDRDYGWNDRHDQGFWPAEAAAGVVGAAVGTGVGIATAPFRTDTYAWDNGDRGGWSESYARRNGFVCRPGTLFRGEDGRPHLCQ